MRRGEPRTHRAMEGGIGTVGTVPGGLATIGVEARTDWTGLDQGDEYAERSDLVREGFAESFEGVLGGAVGGEHRERDETEAGTQLDDATRAAFAHVRERELCDADDREEVQLHLRAEVLERELFDDAEDRRAGVVHDDVDAMPLGERRSEDPLDRRCVREVDLEYVDAGESSAERGRVFVPANGGEDVVAGGMEPGDGRETDTRRGTRDENGGHGEVIPSWTRTTAQPACARRRRRPRRSAR